MAAVVLPSARLHGAAGPQSVKPAAASSILALLEEDDDGLKVSDEQPAEAMARRGSVSSWSS